MNTDLFLFELEEATAADPGGQEDAEGARPTPGPLPEPVKISHK